MKKITTLILIAVLISVGFFSGCTESQPSPNRNLPTTIDSDGDGYPDDVDDFPSDSNLHKRIDILSSTWTYEPRKGGGAAFNVDSDSKFVIVNWEVTYPNDLTEYEKREITFTLRQSPNLHQDVYYHYDNVNNRNLRFTISSSNWGKWEYGFGSGFVNRSITIRHEIYILK